MCLSRFTCHSQYVRGWRGSSLRKLTLHNWPGRLDHRSYFWVVVCDSQWVSPDHCKPFSCPPPWGVSEPCSVWLWVYLNLDESEF